jgi:hypothetical protein
MPGHNDDCVVVGEWRLTANHLEEDDAQGVEIRARVEGLALRLLGRHVPRRSEDRARLRLHGIELAGLVVEHLGDAEVEDLENLAGFARRSHFGEEQIVGLEIAVNDAFGVRLGQRAQGLQCRVDCVRGAEPRAAGDALAEGFAVEQLHGQIELTGLGLTEVEDRHRMW